MQPWAENLIKGVARGVTTFATVSWSWGKLRKQLRKFGGEVSDRATDFGSSARDFVSDAGERISAFGSRAQEIDLQGSVQAAPDAMKRVVSHVRGEPMREKKRGWSFFKVILVLGVFIGLAVFLLDKFLPKPYRDEELDEGWPGDSGYDPEDETLANPLDADEESKVGGDGTGDEDEEDKDE